VSGGSPGLLDLIELSLDPSVYALERNDPEAAMKLRAKQIVEGTWREEDDEIILKLQDNHSEIAKRIAQWDREHPVVIDEGLIKLLRGV
jgi:hypothetical protein